MDYKEFLDGKTHFGDDSGFDPIWVPDFLYEFQVSLLEWAVRKGRSAIFADCGLGKTPIQLVWAENICRKTSGKVLIVTPLAVGAQTIREGEKFGIECARSVGGVPVGRITVTNYERLHHFNPTDYEGVVCDESSAIKNFDGKHRALVTEFLRTRKYRLMCTATAAPNDYIELGNTSEALGAMGYTDMLTRFFKNEQNTIKPMVYRHKGQNFAALSDRAKWRFKHHAEKPFWRWVCSWARALRFPSDLGFDDDGFILPALIERETIVKTDKLLPGELFRRAAVGLKDQRAERRMTINERCEMAASIANEPGPVVVWCHLNKEGDLLEKLIPDAVQVAGSDSDEKKEEALLGFSNGSIRALVTKPRIGAFGLNWQHCDRMTFFPSHSYEQYYQGVRRCWRFGQQKPVTVDIITTEGELGVLKNLQRKADAADKMFSELVAHMNDPLAFKKTNPFKTMEVIPEWL